MIDVTVKLPEAGAMMKKLGLDQRGEVQRVIAEEALGLCDSIVPFRSGMLKQSGHVENNGECIVWNQPYARYQYYGISWFMNANNHDNYDGVKQSEVILMDYGVDQWRIYAAFIAQYHIDLNKVNMHWFIFRGLLDNLSECSFTDVMQLRQKKIPSYLSAKEKEEFKRKQKIFQLGKTGKVKEDDFTESEKARIAEFLKYANIKK